MSIATKDSRGAKSSGVDLISPMALEERNAFFAQKANGYYAQLRLLESKGDLKQKLNGIHYTPYGLARILLQDLTALDSTLSKTFLDPCAGLGFFIFAYLDLLIENEVIKSSAEFKEILKNIYYADIDADAAEEFQNIFSEYYSAIFNENIQFLKANMQIGDALFTNVDQYGIGGNLLNAFKLESIDYIFTNPPYLLLKKGQVDSSQANEHVSEISSKISGVKHFKFVTGVPNLYKLFVEQICEHWIAADGQVGLLIPRGFLTDNQSQDLRLRIIENFRIGKIYDLPEKSSYFPEIGQAFSVFTLTKGEKTKDIKIFGYENSQLNLKTPVTNTSLKTFTKLNKSAAIVPLNQDDLEFLVKFVDLPKVSSYSAIKNLRGELDLTLDKDFITKEETKYRLVKGTNLGHYQLKETDEFVEESFRNRAKGFWSDLERIACQQISNQNQARRLKWALIPPKHILGNSCNYVGILAQEEIFETEEIDLMYLLAVFNSNFMNRRFKILSPNNHISNVEISEMPLVLPNIDLQRKIGKKATELSKSFDEKIFAEIEKELEGIFGL